MFFWRIFLDSHPSVSQLQRYELVAICIIIVFVVVVGGGGGGEDDDDDDDDDDDAGMWEGVEEGREE